MTFFKIIGVVILVFIVIQFIPVDRTNKPVQLKDNFVSLKNSPVSITKILQKACYDCHSNETIYPAYAYIAPISWSIKRQVNEGREHLNFSEWGTYNQFLKKGMLENSIANLEQKRMPLPGYVAQHPKARLTSQEKSELIVYFKSILSMGDY